MLKSWNNVYLDIFKIIFHPMILYVNHLYQIWNFLITAQINLNYPEWQNSVSICPGGAQSLTATHTKKKKKKNLSFNMFLNKFFISKSIFTELETEPKSDRSQIKGENLSLTSKWINFGSLTTLRTSLFIVHSVFCTACTGHC